MKAKIKNLVAMFIVFTLVMSNVPLMAAAAYVTGTRNVSANEVYIGGDDEVEVNLNIVGQPPVNVVKPNDVILVLDKSGSMQMDPDPARFGAMIESAKEFIDLVDFDEHRVGVVDYSGEVGSYNLSTDGTAIKSYIDSIKCSGGTYTHDAIRKASEILTTQGREDAQPVIILLTDGEPKSKEWAIQAATEAKEAGIVFYTIALLGKNVNPDTSAENAFLKELATTASHHHFVLGSVGLIDIYRAIVKEIGIASAYDVEITETVPEGFEIVPGSYEHNIPQPTLEGNTLKWNMLELKSNTLELSYKVKLKDITIKPGKYNLVNKVTYKDYAGRKCNYAVNNTAITVKHLPPVIESITPDKGEIAGGETATIRGENFREGLTVKFGTVAATDVKVVDSQTITLTVPASATSRSTVDVVVTNDDAQKASITYNYIGEPVVTSITPNSGAYEGGTAVTIKGSLMDKNTKVYFDGKEATFKSIVSDRQLVVVTPPASKQGLVDVTVVNSEGTTTTITDGFEYLEPAVTSITIAPAVAEVNIGDSQQLTVTGVLSDGSTKDITASTNGTKYRTSNSAVATVDTEGNVTVKATAREGQTCTITATYNSLTAKATIQVIDTTPKVTAIELNETAISLEEGQTHTIIATAIYSDGTTKTIEAADATYRSNSTAVATVDANGQVGITSGAIVGKEARITVTYEGCSAILEVTVDGVVATGIEVTKPTVELEPGQTHTIETVLVYSDGTKEAIEATDATYRTSSAAVATVDTNGVITVKDTATVGATAKITVSYDGFTAAVSVTVLEPSVTVEALEVSDTALLLKAGESKNLTVKAIYSDGTSEDITTNGASYRTGNSAIATVDAEGCITVKDTAEIGKQTTITVTYKGMTAKVTVQVDGVVLTGIEADQETVELEPGQSHQLTVYAVYSDGTKEDITTNGATYRRSNTEVAEITSEGLITVLDTATVGKTTTITIAYNGYSTRVIVTADGKVVAGIETPALEVPVMVGESYNLSVCAVYDDGSTEDVTADASYRASNDYATVDANGCVTVADTTAVGQKTTITITYSGYTLRVIVVADGVTATAIEAEQAEVEVEQGKTHEIKLNAMMSDGSVKAIEPTDVTYKTNSTAIATVNSSGVVTVKETARVGATCTITATYNDLTTKVTIIVLESSFKVVDLETGDSTIYLEAGDTHALSVYAIYNDGTKVDVTTDGTTYRTGNSTIATIDANGVITVKPTAVVGRQTTITIISKGITKKVVLVVDGVVTESISLAETTATVGRGQSYQASVQATYSDGTQADVTTNGAAYRTGNSAIATVDANGVVTVKETAAVGAKTTLTATYDGYSVRMSIVVGE